MSLGGKFIIFGILFFYPIISNAEITANWKLKLMLPNKEVKNIQLPSDKYHKIYLPKTAWRCGFEKDRYQSTEAIKYSIKSMICRGPNTKDYISVVTKCFLDFGKINVNSEREWINTLAASTIHIIDSKYGQYTLQLTCGLSKYSKL